MNILVLNGSPKGPESNTYRITDAFLNGFKKELGENADIETVHLYDTRIEHCRGCYRCWTATPGKCVIHDDMEALLPKIIASDLVIWSFPLYYYGMPSKLKAFLDRNLPLNLPFMEKRPDGGGAHPSRYDTKPAGNVLISTCGFYSRENNYEALLKQFDILFPEGYTKIICPEGELLSHKELHARTNEYLSYAFQAGREYALGKSISEKTAGNLAGLLYAPEAYTAMADASWEIQDDTKPLSDKEKAAKAAERFTRQMAATYNPLSFDGKKRVFEIFYTDIQAGYQLVMGKEHCEVLTGDFLPYTTRVETPLTVWQDISKGLYNGEQAMMEGKYRTLGDLKLLMAWDRYFGAPAGKTDTENHFRTNMFFLIFPWCLIWQLLSINPVAGGIAGICTAVCMHFANLKWKLTIYDYITCLCVTLFSLCALLDYDMRTIVPLSYLSFGLMWFLSCFTRVPLSAHYSKENYNGDDALKSPLFLKTNRILSLCWGALYLVTPIWTYAIMGGGAPYLIALVNTLLPALLGIFTKWFEKWYPAKVAGGVS